MPLRTSDDEPLWIILKWKPVKVAILGKMEKKKPFQIVLIF